MKLSLNMAYIISHRDISRGLCARTAPSSSRKRTSADRNGQDIWGLRLLVSMSYNKLSLFSKRGHITAVSSPNLHLVSLSTGLFTVQEPDCFSHVSDVGDV